MGRCNFSSGEACQRGAKLWGQVLDIVKRRRPWRAGWALLGLVDTLADLPAGINGREALVANLRSMASVLRDLQSENGHWHTVLDHPETYLESSISCFDCAAFLKGMRTGLLDFSFEECVRRSRRALLGAVSQTGQILVSEATPEGDLASYQALALGVFPWGQGPALRAIEELLISSGAVN